MLIPFRSLRSGSLWTLLALLWQNAPAPGSGMAILPAEIKLSGRAARQQLIVEQVRDSGPGQPVLVGPITNEIRWESSDPRVVRVANGVVFPVTNGSATLSAKLGNEATFAKVSVSGMDKPFEWSFRNHVQPVLARNGCSAGACHGAAAGQSGFRLSLRGYDNDGDYLALTRHALGRRVSLADPGRSMILTKPTAALPHKGGKRFEIDSPDYQVLSEWIAAGTPGPRSDDPRINRVEVLPEHVVLRPGDTQPLLVRAYFSDGHSEDVTHWAKFNSANAAVSVVDDNGVVKVAGHGEGAVTAWYLSRIATATVTAPYPVPLSSEVFASAPRRNFIDELVLEKLRDLNLPPSPRSSDSEFVRRVYLDTVGILPTPAETRAFLTDPAPTKRDALIEQLLHRQEFVDYWTYRWSDLLLVNSKKLKPAAMWSYYNWIRNNVAANTPWDTLVRQLITAQGSTLDNGAGNFYVLHDDPRSLTETSLLAFLGMSINCAKCHNHPMEKWTNDEYYGMANLFARVRTKSGTADGDNIVFVSSEGDLVQPLTGKPQPPRPLDGKPLSIDSTEDRRIHLANWMVSRENPYFSRAIVNRLWANFFGAGLVENVDDLRVTNPASNEKLLTAGAAYLADQRFDLKALMRLILQSETYQRTSATLRENAADTRFYSHYYPRRLMAEVLLDAISQSLNAPEKFPGYPESWRAIQLPDVNVNSYFLKTFGRPERNVTCECERTAEPSVTQVLHIANGDTLNRKLTAKNNCISKAISEKVAAAAIIEEAYLRAFSRIPSEPEKIRLTAMLSEGNEKEFRPMIEDMYWALLSSKEFLFNH